MANPEDPDRFKANPASREMMRSLADRFGVSVPLGLGVLQGAAERMLEALKTARLDLYMTARVDLGRAMDSIADELDADEKVYAAIGTVDPRLAEAVAPIWRRLEINARRRDMKDDSVREIADAFAKHWVQCKEPDTCAELEAYRVELRARGVEIPSWTGRTR